MATTLIKLLHLLLAHQGEVVFLVARVHKVLLLLDYHPTDGTLDTLHQGDWLLRAHSDIRLRSGCGLFEALEGLTLSQDLGKLLRAALLEPLGTLIVDSVETLIELHPLVVQVLDGLHQQLLDCADLVLLLALIKRLKLLLEPKCKLEQIAVVLFVLADNRVTLQDASCLVSLNQGAQFLMGTAFHDFRFLNDLNALLGLTQDRLLGSLHQLRLG